jgi:hypothetical protein
MFHDALLHNDRYTLWQKFLYSLSNSVPCPINVPIILLSFPKPKICFLIVTWYCSLTSPSFNFFRLNLSGRICTLKRDKVRGEWRKLHIEELHNLYSFRYITELGGQDMWHAWERRGKCAKVMVGKLEGKKPLGRPRRRWQDEIKTNLGEISWGRG